MRTHVWSKSVIRLSRQGRRLPFQRHARTFHAASRALAPTPSPSSDPASSPPNPPGADNGDGAGAGKDYDAVAAAAAAAAADASKIRKEQALDKTTSEAATPAAADRSVNRRRGRQYSSKPKELPSFQVPDLFYRFNVRLHESHTTSTTKGAQRRVFTLVDRESGHTVLTLPYTPAALAAPNDQPQPSNELQAQLSAADYLVEHSVAGQRAIDPKSLMYLHAQLLVHAAFAITGPASTKFGRSNIEIHSPDIFVYQELDKFVEELADLVQADVVRLDANDLADLAGDYVDNGHLIPGSISALAYDVYKDVRTARFHRIDLPSPEDQEQSGDIDPESVVEDAFANIDAGQLSKFFKQNAASLSKALSSGRVVGLDLNKLSTMQADSAASSESRSASAPVATWDEYKLQIMLDTLLDTPAVKRNSPPSERSRFDPFFKTPFDPVAEQQEPHASAEPSPSSASAPPTHDELASFFKDYLTRKITPKTSKHHGLSTSDEEQGASDAPAPKGSQSRTIIHVRELDHIRNTSQGDAVINRLLRIVQRRRRDGEQIVIVGTNGSSDHPALSGITDPEHDDMHFRVLRYPNTSSTHQANAPALAPLFKLDRALGDFNRVAEINFRNILDMLRRLDVSVSEDIFAPSTRSHFSIPGTAKLGEMVLPPEDIQQTVVVAESFRQLYTRDDALSTFHLAFATGLIHSIENTLDPFVSAQIEPIIPTARPRGSSKSDGGDSKRAGPNKIDLDQLKRNCSKHEQRLLSGVVDPNSIKTTFSDVHAAPETIEALKTLTTLSLLRPEAFSYGVLANDRLPGLLLYGPPGTGKTLLARAVAKESRATVLSVSGAQVYEKYVGEGEKMVRAVFSLAKKLPSPCVVFIDEADALFGSRGGGAGTRTSHREIINQFLREWDGMDDHSVFIMVATNRPFDLDDAVLRRLPRRLLVDLPVAKDRESILGIHLKGEALDPAISLSRLAEQTPLYSGSDLKNLCVAAALAAVREENDLLTQHKDDKDFKLPERRTLTSGHFDRALSEISASINEDMSSLAAIRKFDEQFGDRRARKKKTSYGFGLGSGADVVDERAARVRQDEVKP